MSFFSDVSIMNKGTVCVLRTGIAYIGRLVELIAGRFNIFPAYGCAENSFTVLTSSGSAVAVRTELSCLACCEVSAFESTREIGRRLSESSVSSNFLRYSRAVLIDCESDLLERVTVNDTFLDKLTLFKSEMLVLIIVSHGVNLLIPGAA